MAETTTIRIRRETRERLRAVSAASGANVADLIDGWARAADERLTLRSAAAAWDGMDPDRGREFHVDSDDLDGFSADLPEY